MLAKIDLESIEAEGNAVSLADKISEIFMEFNASLDIDNWAEVKKMATTGTKPFSTLASEYLTDVQGKFNQIIEKMGLENHLNFKFGIPFNPITQAMYTNSNFVHLLVEQHRIGYAESRWLLESEINDFGFKLKPNATPVRLLVWNRSDLFNDKKETENYAFFLKLYNVEQILDFPLDAKAYINIDPDDAIAQLMEVVDEYGIKLNRLGIPYNDDEQISCVDDVLYISKPTLPDNTLYCSSLNSKEFKGAEVVALLETILQVDKENRHHSDDELNILGHVFGQSIASHLKLQDGDKQYKGSYYLLKQIVGNKKLTEGLVDQIIIKHDAALDGLRKINSTVPFSIYSLIKDSTLLERQEIRAVLLNKAVDFYNTGAIQKIIREVSLTANQKQEFSYMDRFMGQLKAQFQNEPELLSDLIEDRLPLLENAFNQLMDSKSTMAGDVTTEEYFRAVTTSLVNSFHTRIKKLNVLERDWIAHLQSQTDLCQNMATREERLMRAHLIKKINEEVNAFFDLSLASNQFVAEKIEENYLRIKNQLS